LRFQEFSVVNIRSGFCVIDLLFVFGSGRHVQGDSSASLSGDNMMLASRLAHGTVLLMSLVSQQASCVVDVVDCGLTPILFRWRSTVLI
jgi:hypothetical protein